MSDGWNVPRMSPWSRWGLLGVDTWGATRWALVGHCPAGRPGITLALAGDNRGLTLRIGHDEAQALAEGLTMFAGAWGEEAEQEAAAVLRRVAR